MCKAGGKCGNAGIGEIEKMGIEMELLAGFKVLTIQVRGAEDEGPGPIDEPAGSAAAGRAWLK
jgi:hypothetical protein